MTKTEIESLADAIVKRLDLPTKSEILEAISEGVSIGMPVSSVWEEAIAKAFPYASEITDAIWSPSYRAQGGK